MPIKRVAIKTIIVIAIIMLFRTMFVSPLLTKAQASAVGAVMAAHAKESVDESDPNAASLRSVVMNEIMYRSPFIWSNTVIDLLILLILVGAFYELCRLDKADEQTAQA